jgi:hypothetical protein
MVVRRIVTIAKKKKSTQVISSRFVLQLGNMKGKKNREISSKYLPTLQIKWLLTGV